MNKRERRAVPVGDTDPFRPSPERPVRCRAGLSKLMNRWKKPPRGN